MQEFIMQAMEVFATPEGRTIVLFAAGAISCVEFPEDIDFPVRALFSAGFCGVVTTVLGRLGMWLLVPLHLQPAFTAGVLGLSVARLIWREVLQRKKPKEPLDLSVILQAFENPNSFFSSSSSSRRDRRLASSSSSTPAAFPGAGHRLGTGNDDRKQVEGETSQD